ncbi:MAG: hypothetical protein A2428_03135 [Bdellovibrionales bacterium RIFOXYC1_FULL_54_43]|nr:MAG: hypothetical protein A2428_03135 [Bdellovibrionales bacterium RIFOXYC1_FULL_54_43]OFZ82675.1 MAG: hypothetical protein A2603_02570 [Bdellovibrionales bacterium RIFOXYD1_FULL_55_31]
MPSQIIVFKKNICDYGNSEVVLSASAAGEFVNYLRDRSNRTGWMTTGSSDAEQVTLTADFGDTRDFDSLLLVKQNFKSYSAQYEDPVTEQMVDFSTPINVLNNQDEVAYHHFQKVASKKLEIKINGTMIPNSEKRMCQLIATELRGQFQAWPVIKDPTHSRNRTKTKMLSGKQSVRENVGGTSFKLKVKILKNQADIDLVESMYDSSEGFLVWPCGGDSSQFISSIKGYRKEDIFLMKCENEYESERYGGFYQSGIELGMNLAEVVD